jgi:methylglutaconyl-CoA hydratase
MDYKTLDIVEEHNIVTIALNRPEVHNAMNDLMIQELTECFRALNKKRAIRAAILTGKGRTFCGGADLHWMKSMVHYSKEENIDDSRKLLDLFDAIYSCQKPVIGRINGGAFGGGVGLVAACDITIAPPDVTFAFSETKLGLIPSIISPYVIRRIGPARARRLFITGERFSSAYAQEIGLIDSVVDPEKIDERMEYFLKEITTAAPLAIGEAKNLIKAHQELDSKEYTNYTLYKIAELRISEEGQEGTTAFLEKRKPKWRN